MTSLDNVAAMQKQLFDFIWNNVTNLKVLWD